MKLRSNAKRVCIDLDSNRVFLLSRDGAVTRSLCEALASHATLKPHKPQAHARSRIRGKRSITFSCQSTPPSCIEGRRVDRQSRTVASQTAA